jgi:hypothetical protein
MDDNQKTNRARVNVGESETIIYSNDFQIAWSPWDFKMTFGRILKADDEVMEVKPLADVYVSPQHALAIAAVLTRQLQLYEEKVGSIPKAGVVVDSDSSDDTH